MDLLITMNYWLSFLCVLVRVFEVCWCCCLYGFEMGRPESTREKKKI